MRSSKHSKHKNRRSISIVCAVTAAIAAVICAYLLIHHLVGVRHSRQVNDELRAQVSEAYASATPSETEQIILTPTPLPTEETITYSILSEYSALYAQNSDLIGWLRIDDTVIDYPVVQTPEDEDEYLYLNFLKEYDVNGTLIMDTDSVVGVGTAEYDYEDGARPSTNLIIHGHTMASGDMFGHLWYYEDADYGAEHSTIYFDSLYEERTYELIACFYSQIYYPDDDVFKFYKFFQADTQEEFDYWYDNIMSMALYDTGVTAEFGDEFITLTCCSYQVEDGRFVVIGKRVS